MSLSFDGIGVERKEVLIIFMVTTTNCGGEECRVHSNISPTHHWWKVIM